MVIKRINRYKWFESGVAALINKCRKRNNNLFQIQKQSQIRCQFKLEMKTK